MNIQVTLKRDIPDQLEPEVKAVVLEIPEYTLEDGWKFVSAIEVIDAKIPKTQSSIKKSFPTTVPGKSKLFRVRNTIRSAYRKEGSTTLTDPNCVGVDQMTVTRFLRYSGTLGHSGVLYETDPGYSDWSKFIDDEYQRQYKDYHRYNC